MANPIYRATLFASDGVTPLTPRAGASHSDDFKVATKSGVTGFQPYLDLPRGRRARIDPVERSIESGFMTLKLLDKKTAAGNLERWWTAFAGDLEGRVQQLGLTMLIEESTNDGGTWADWYKGEVRRASLDGSRLWATIRLRDLGTKLDQRVFVGLPHSSITYAFLPNVLPAGGLVKEYGPFPTIRPIRCKAKTWSTPNAGSGIRLDVDFNNYRPDGEEYHTLAMTTAAFRGSSDNVADIIVRNELLAHVTFVGGARDGESGYMQLRWTGPDVSGATIMSPYAVAPSRWGLVLRSVGVQELPASDPRYIQAPANAQAIDLRIELATEPDDRAPLYTNEVHPVQFMADLLDGKFGRINKDGTVAWTIPRESGSFSTLIADTSLQKVRSPRPGPEKLHDVLKELCQTANLALFRNRSGEVQVVDMRPQASSYGSLTTIGNSDLATDSAPSWMGDADEAITDLRVTWYLERHLTPMEWVGDHEDIVDVVAGGIVEKDALTLPFPYGRTGLSQHRHTIDAKGIRAQEMMFVFLDPTDHPERRRAQERTEHLARELEGPFGHGVMSAGLVCRRTAAVAGINPGDLRIVDVDELPDPATNLRGGPRVMRCLGVDEDGPIVRLDMMDLGPDSVAVGPSLGTMAATSGNEKHSATIPVTVNGDSERARLDIAVTPTSTGTRPAEASGLWTEVARPAATGDVVVGGLNPGKRVWARARTEPGPDDDPKLASGWVFPASPGYADLTALSPPTNGSASVQNGSETILTWTVGEADYPLVVRLGDDAVEVLPKGSNRYVLRGTDASISYTAKIAHLDPVSGGESATLDIGFTSGATPGVCPIPDGLVVIVGELV